MGFLDLSPAGARFAHGVPLCDWAALAVDLSPALGGARSWPKSSGAESLDIRGGRGKGRGGLAYQGVLTLPVSTPEEQAALTAALVCLAGK